jgi:hypothetical protein
MGSTIRAAAVLLAAILGLPGCDRTATIPEVEAPPASASLSRSRPQGTIYRENLNGELAFLRTTVRDEDGSTLTLLLVSREGGPRARTVLEFLVIRCAPECFVRSGGIGAIPRGDFRGNLAQGYTLHTDLSGNPSFTLEEGQSGAIGLRWTADGLEEQRWSGSQEERWGGYYRKRTGNEWRRSATVDGGIFGDGVIGREVDGWMGTTRGMSIEVASDGSGVLR